MNLQALNKATAQGVRTGGISPFSEIEIARCYANQAQPRKSFENIEELAQSIKRDGLIQPIAVVKRDNGRYMIVSGERRFRASMFAGLTTIKAHILDIDDAKVQELALVENIQREDLSDFEKAKYIGELWASGRYAHKQDLAHAIGKSASYISKAFSCLRLDPTIQSDIEENKHDIGLTVLEEIARIKDKAAQRELYKSYVSGSTTRDAIAAHAKENKISRGKKLKRKYTVTGNSINGGLSIANLLDKESAKNFTHYKITIEEI